MQEVAAADGQGADGDGDGQRRTWGAEATYEASGLSGGSSSQRRKQQSLTTECRPVHQQSILLRITISRPGACSTSHCGQEPGSTHLAPALACGKSVPA